MQEPSLNKPTDNLTKSGLDGKKVVDKLGRIFTLRKPDLLQQYDFLKALGEDASNNNLIGIMLPLLFIAKIDNEVFETPHIHSECRAALKRVKEEGIIAVRDAISEDSPQNVEEEKDAIKK